MLHRPVVGSAGTASARRRFGPFPADPRFSELRALAPPRGFPTGLHPPAHGRPRRPARTCNGAGRANPRFRRSSAAHAQGRRRALLLAHLRSRRSCSTGELLRTPADPGRLSVRTGGKASIPNPRRGRVAAGAGHAVPWSFVLDVAPVASATGTDMSDAAAHAFNRDERCRLSAQVRLVARKRIDAGSEALEALRGVARKRPGDPDSFKAVVVPAGSCCGFGNVGVWQAGQWVNSSARSSA